MSPARAKPDRPPASRAREPVWPHGPAHGDPAHEAWRLLALGIHRFKEIFLVVCAGFELSPVQARVLMELDPRAPVPMSALAGVLSCDASNVTGLVDRLEARGLIERRADESDRRVKSLVVTPLGARMRRKILERIARPPPSLRELPARDLEQLARILGRLQDADTEENP